MNAKEALIVLALLLVGATAVFTAANAKASQNCELPPMESLGFTNRSGAAITEIRLSQPGGDSWSDNLLKTPLKDGEKRGLRLTRGLLPGASSIKIVHEDGRENIWHRLPLRNIFEITEGRDGKPVYNIIPVGS